MAASIHLLGKVRETRAKCALPHLVIRRTEFHPVRDEKTQEGGKGKGEGEKSGGEGARQEAGAKLEVCTLRASSQRADIHSHFNIYCYSVGKFLTKNADFLMFDFRVMHMANYKG